MAIRSGVFVVLAFISSLTGNCQDGYIRGKPALAYWTVGNQSETVVLLHGGPGVAHPYLRPEWDTLSQVARLIYYDQRGGGKSDRADCYAWRAHVGDLKRVIDTLAKGKKVILMGTSWGSFLAVLYAYIYPRDVKGIILSGTVTWQGKGEATKDCTAYAEPSERDTVRWVQFNEGSNDSVVRADTLLQKRMQAKKLSWNPKVTTATMNSLESAPTLEQLKSINAPVLLIGGNGNCDMKDRGQQYVGIFPNLTAHSVDGACHDPWFSHPQQVFPACIRFIQTLP